MKVYKLDKDSSWAYRIDLEPYEWPPFNYDDTDWLDRPIRRWVYDNCYPGAFFAADGMILFQRPEDAVQFQLTWSL